MTARPANRLLALLPDDDFTLLRDKFEKVDLPRGTVLAEPGQPLTDVYFLEDGLASQIAFSEDGKQIEVGIYGRDGFGPFCLLLGVDRTPHAHIVQLAGHGYKIPAKRLIELTERNPKLQGLLSGYIYVAMVQTAQTALAKASSRVGQRLARWLLMCHDRVDGDDIAVTHEFLGVMLGVRRTGVTDAVHVLEGGGVIRGRRGLINIRDRAKLEEIAGNSYGLPEAEYARVLGGMS